LKRRGIGEKRPVTGELIIMIIIIVVIII